MGHASISDSINIDAANFESHVCPCMFVNMSKDKEDQQACMCSNTNSQKKQRLSPVYTGLKMYTVLKCLLETIDFSCSSWRKFDHSFTELSHQSKIFSHFLN